MAGCARIARRVPTEAGVARLLERFGVPEEGAVIEWEQIENCLGLGREACRFRSVVAAWRRRLYRECNCFLHAPGDGSGLVVADPPRRVDLAARKVEYGRRCISRAVVLAHSTERTRLDATEREVADRISRMGDMATALHAAVAAKALPLPEMEDRRKRATA